MGCRFMFVLMLMIGYYTSNGEKRRGDAYALQKLREIEKRCSARFCAKRFGSAMRLRIALMTSISLRYTNFILELPVRYYCLMLPVNARTMLLIKARCRVNIFQEVLFWNHG